MNPPGQQNQIMLGYRLDSLTTFKNDVEARIPDMEKRVKFFNNLANENIQFEMVLRVAHHVFPRFMIANALQEAPWTKSVEMSELYINRGNMSFAHGDLYEAMSCFTKALRLAPLTSTVPTPMVGHGGPFAANYNQQALVYPGPGYQGYNPQLAVASPEPWLAGDASILESMNQRCKCHANRSAILYEWKRYDDCMLEIERAIDSGYPKELVWCLIFRKAKCLIESKRFSMAESCAAALKCLATTLQGNDAATAAKARVIVRQMVQTAEDAAQQEREFRPRRRKYQPLDTIPVHDSALFFSSSRFFTIYIESHKKFSFMSSALKECEADGQCHGMYAIAEVLPGAVLVKEPVVERFLDYNCWGTHCFNCFSLVHDTGLPSCFTPAIIFCSKKCATLECSHGFDKICGALPYLAGPDNAGNRFVRLAFRLFVTRPWHEIQSVLVKEIPRSQAAKTAEAEYLRQIEIALEPRVEKHTYDTKWAFQRAVESLYVARLLVIFEYVLPSDSIVRHLGVAVFRLARAMQYAGFLCEERMPDEPNETMTIVKPVGIMFAPTLGRWNHSCFPNVAIQYNRGFVYARAVKNIKPGQEITFSYVPDLYRGVGREQRMTLLKENWGFDCACQGCTTDIIVRGEFSLALLRCEVCGFSFKRSRNGGLVCTNCCLPGMYLYGSVRTRLEQLDRINRGILSNMRKPVTDENLKIMYSDLRHKLLPRFCEDVRYLQDRLVPTSALVGNAVEVLRMALDFAFSPLIRLYPYNSDIDFDEDGNEIELEVEKLVASTK